MHVCLLRNLSKQHDIEKTKKEVHNKSRIGKLLRRFETKKQHKMQKEEQTVVEEWHIPAKSCLDPRSFKL